MSRGFSLIEVVTAIAIVTIVIGAGIPVVLRTLEPNEIEVDTEDGSRYLTRIAPYRTAENVIEGVVITFFDTTRFKSIPYDPLDSIAPFCRAAEWIEREMWELLGIRFRNHPDLRHLLLDDDWPEGQYPLRRDYRAEP